MMIHQTAGKLRGMKLPAMAAEYLRQSESRACDALDFDERVGMMADAEWRLREDSRIQRLTKAAKLRLPGACFADIDYRPSRKLDKAAVARLSDFGWAKDARNLIITGATGCGKTWLACAFGAEACRLGLRVSFFRANRLVNVMTASNGAGTLDKLLNNLKKADILILDDWGLATLNPLESRLLLELFEDRYNERSTVFAAQAPVAKWHELFEDGTIADAILDRVVHNSHRFELSGQSLRAKLGGGAENGGDSIV